MNQYQLLIYLVILLFFNDKILSNSQEQIISFHYPKSSKYEFLLNDKLKSNQKQTFQMKNLDHWFHDCTSQIYSWIQSFHRYLNEYGQQIVKPQLQRKVYYRQNFASQTGGAQILMVSSPQIQSAKTILRNDPDAYLFSPDILPLTLIIGLKQQILIDSFVIQSGEVYSCITEHFMVEGSFSLDNQQWIMLGHFRADFGFQKQEFKLDQNIVRYIKLTILSSYGNWRYFTLSQIKVYGEGLFSHAMENLLHQQYKRNLTNQAQNISNQTLKQNKNLTLVHQLQIQQEQAFDILVQAFDQVRLDNKKQKKKKGNKQKSKKKLNEQYFLSELTRLEGQNMELRQKIKQFYVPK